jgi:predicted DNA-binding protein (MmcQ/YjbR family)
VFVIARFDEGEPRFSFKVSELAYEILKDQPGLRPAPYLASRGLKWIQHFEAPGLSDDELQDYLRQAHRIVAQGLSRKKRKELGIE